MTCNFFQLRILFLLFLFLLALPAQSATRAVEVTGLAPANEESSRSNLRHAAIRDAMEKSVLSVTMELIANHPGPQRALAEELDTEKLQAILGNGLETYTARFRIIEDLGNQPSSEPGSGEDYAVRVAVQVDESRLRRHLLDTELIYIAPVETGPVQNLQIVLQGISSYQAYAVIRDAVSAASPSAEASPVEFQMGQAILKVETGRSASSIYPEIARSLPPEIQVSLVGIMGNSLVLRVAEIEIEDSEEGNLPEARP